MKRGPVHALLLTSPSALPQELLPTPTKPTDLLLSQDSTDHKDLDDEETDAPRAMNQALANSLWRALNTPEPHVGSTPLLHLTAFWNTPPATRLARDLMGFTTTGPQKDGTRFHDPNRTELLCAYLHFIARGGSVDGLVPEEWTAIERILSLPVSQTDLGKVTSLPTTPPSRSSVRRTGRELQLASSSLSFLARCLADELGMERTADRRLCRALRGNTARGSLRTTVRLAIRCILRHGQPIRDDVDLKQGSRVCASDERRRVVEAGRCVSYLGEIVCLLARFFCEEEDVAFGNPDCCFVVADAVSSELGLALPLDVVADAESEGAEEKDTESEGKEEKRAYAKGVRLKFLLSLDVEFARPLRISLGETMELSTELGVVMGF